MPGEEKSLSRQGPTLQLSFAFHPGDLYLAYPLALFKAVYLPPQLYYIYLSLSGSKQKTNKQNKQALHRDTENRLVVARNWEWEVGELGEGGQKVK